MPLDQQAIEKLKDELVEARRALDRINRSIAYHADLLVEAEYADAPLGERRVLNLKVEQRKNKQRRQERYIRDLEERARASWA